MTVTSEAAAAADAGAEGSDAGADGTEEVVDTSIDSEEGGATPEEIAQVLKGTGRTITTTAPVIAAEAEEAAVEDTEEAKPAEGEEAEEAKPEPPKPVEAEKPKPPAEEAPARLTIEIEDADGNKHEISSIADLPDDFSPKSNKQGLEILDQLQDLKARQAAADKEVADTTAEAAKSERVAKIQEGWTNEFKELGVTQKPEQDKIFAYMRAENAKRQEAGRPMIASIEDAKNGMDATAAREAAAEAAKAAKEETRRKGSLVGGGAAPGGATAAPVYRGGARNAVAAARDMGLFD